MAYSAQAVANAFIDLAKKGKIKNLTPMKLQKLMFYVQSWYLKDHDSTPLFDDHFARWKFGPVIPSLYHDLKIYGKEEIDSQISTARADESGFRLVTPRIDEKDEEAINYINSIIEVYGDLSGPQLSILTHEDGTAWSLGEPDGSFISLDEMAEHIHPESRYVE